MDSMSEPRRFPATLDVSGLPNVAFGHRNVTWLANVFYMTIEGMMFALMFATYFYLRTRSSNWPTGHLPPALTYGLPNAVVLALSTIPARWIQRVAPTGDRAALRRGLAFLAAFATIATILRIFEFTTLNCRWTDDAYASTVWVLIGLHSGHLLTELIETLVLLALAFTPKMEGNRLAGLHQLRLLVLRCHLRIDCRFRDLRNNSISVNMATFKRHIDAGKTSWGIWWGLIAGFLAWGVDLGTSYALDQHSCSTGHHYVLHVISLASLIVALSGFAAGFAEFRRFPSNTSGEGGSRFDRAHFQALLGIAFSLSFALVVIAGAVPRWILSPCE